jgi:riboflavin-specific deaminase-like protein
LVVAQLGQTLDGRIATITGDSKWINGQAALTHLHRIRACVDAVVVGVGTVLADDPWLTVRHVPCPACQPARVVIDPQGRVPLDARVFTADGARRLIVSAVDQPTPDGVERLVVPTLAGRMAPLAILAALQSAGLSRLLIEGGATTVSRFIAAGAVDQLHLLVAPMLLGSGKPGLQLADITRIDQALRPVTTLHPFADGDVLFVCDFTQDPR